jgi:hypothetical protein
MVEGKPMLMAEATADAPAEKEAPLEPELPMAQDLAAGTTAAFTKIQILTWNLGERIPIAP